MVVGVIKSTQAVHVCVCVCVWLIDHSDPLVVRVCGVQKKKKKYFTHFALKRWWTESLSDVESAQLSVHLHVKVKTPWIELDSLHRTERIMCVLWYNYISSITISTSTPPSSVGLPHLSRLPRSPLNCPSRLSCHFVNHKELCWWDLAQTHIHWLESLCVVVVTAGTKVEGLRSVSLNLRTLHTCVITFI